MILTFESVVDHAKSFCMTIHIKALQQHSLVMFSQYLKPWCKCLFSVVVFQWGISQFSSIKRFLFPLERLRVGHFQG